MFGFASTYVRFRGARPIVMRGKVRVKEVTDKKKGPGRSDRGPL